MKKLFIPIVAAAAFIVAVGIFLQKSGVLVPTTPPQPSVTVTVGAKTVNIELAKTTEERSKGLSGRSSLEASSGMLFIFDENDKAPQFWMKDMQISLDIIWIKGDKVIKIDKNVPAPAENTPESKLQTYSAGTTVDYVLEVNAGFSDSNSIKVGDSVTTSGV